VKRSDEISPGEVWQLALAPVDPEPWLYLVVEGDAHVTLLLRLDGDPDPLTSEVTAQLLDDERRWRSSAASTRRGQLWSRLDLG